MALPQVLIVPANPLDITEEDLASLVDGLRADVPLTVDVGVVPMRGYGVTWWEVVAIYLATKGVDAVVGDLYGTLIESIKTRAKAWYDDRRAAGGPKGNRPLAIDVRDEEGNVILGLEMQSDGDVKDVTAERQSAPARPRPEAADEVDSSPPDG